MKGRIVFLIIALIIIADQVLKIWIKTSFPTGDTGVSELRWFKLYFIENPGMAWGWKLGNETGKVILTLFRLAAVIFGTWYLGKIIREQYHRGFIVCAALIYAGALGNLIDSMFYGMIFDKGLRYDPVLDDYIGYAGIAQFSSDGYAAFLHGSVVDMLYFPIFQATWPTWIPGIGGKEFEFFSPIFNIADASISVGVLTLLIFQKRFLKRRHKHDPPSIIETNSTVSDKVQVL